MNRLLTALFLTVIFTSIAKAQAPVDCADFLVVCGNTNLRFNSSGPGADDFAPAANPNPSCGVRESQSLWLSIPVESDGRLGFTITPNTNGDDYDFALWGPNATCDALGNTLRCDFAGPTGRGLTGLRPGGGSAGDGFGADIPVRAGETYILLIDNFVSSSRGFEIEWTGSANIAGEPDITTPVIDPICDVNNDDLEPFNLTSIDEIISNGDPNINVTYHITENDAILGNNAIDKNHTVSNGDVVYARGTFVENGCADITDFAFVLNPTPANVTITGPASVCPEVSGITYTVSGDDDYDYVWSIGGGNITSGNTGNQITVDWLDTNPDAFLEVVPTTAEGCVGETIRLDVTINTRLEPAAPAGPLQLCLEEFTEATYSAVLSTGSQYQWTVVNGTIISPNGTNEITVRWDTDVPGEISYREFNPAIADCEGTSPLVTVTFFPEVFATSTVTDVSCFGESTGAIEVIPTGGTGTLSVTWDDGITGPDRMNLPIGTYTYTVTDENMCSITGMVTVSQPDELFITSLNTGNLVCFQDNSGFAQSMVMGGTSPYSYEWSLNGQVLALSGSDVSGLSAGNYILQVTDANDCVVSQNFVITEPDLLEPDLDQLINNPICPQTSDGQVTVGAKGGTPDYEFIWQLTPVQNDATATGLPRGNYTVIIRDANGCQTSQEVEVRELFPRVFLPTAFSPNGDGANDTFEPIPTCDLNSFRLMVFNQWGTPAFVTTDVNSGWSGTIDGEAAPDGNYAYALSYSFNVNGRLFNETIRGEIKVLR